MTNFLRSKVHRRFSEWLNSNCFMDADRPIYMTTYRINMIGDTPDIFHYVEEEIESYGGGLNGGR